MLTVKDGIVLLTLADGSVYKPSAKEIYAQKDNGSFEHKGYMYPSLSTLGIRFSSLSITPVIRVKNANENLVIELYITKRNVETKIVVSDGIFNDYVIVNNTWYYVNDSVDIINSTIKRYKINPLSLSYSEYVKFKREMSLAGYDIEDAVVSYMNELTQSSTSSSPAGLKATLFPYQEGGSRWISYMVNHGCGCVLADEMGLGKTLQIISVMGILKEEKHNAHFLVVCPVSLLVNWQREIAKFYPSLSTYIHYGAKRTGNYQELLAYDVTIMSYSCAVTDTGLLTMIKWDLLVIDEAQNIKNPSAKRTKAVKGINTVVPIAVTGTPFENHMTDIWSIMDFVLPGFLGNLHQFEETFPDDVDSAVKLEKIISPILLRRRVSEVAKDLPERIDIPQPILMTEEEASLYESNRVSDDSIGDLKSMQLSKIQKLRTFCTHPFVYNEHLDTVDPTSVSNKYSRLCEILEEIFEKKEKVVIFTSFRKMIELIYNDVKNRFGVYTDYIDGSVAASDRQARVDAFSDKEGAGLLVLNPKAAGAGLNITCANHAIHYNLEWNPAIEDQASARIYRRGQNKTVFIHRLYYVDTIEEIINEKIQNKRKLSSRAVIGNDGSTADQEYLLKALSVSPFKNK